MTWSRALIISFMVLGSVSLPVKMMNVAFQRNITAKYTCGEFGDEVYYNHTEAFWSSADRTPKICSPESFPANYMVDGFIETFWQSSSRNRLYADPDLGKDDVDTIIEIDLLQEFLIQQINVIMSDSKRPNRLSVSKSVDGKTWTTFAYKVSIETECVTYFGVKLSSQPADDNGFVCSSYGQPMANKNEMIIFDFSHFIQPVWKRGRYLRLMFYQMHLTLGISGDKFQHYTVSELEVIAECTCNDLETACIRNNITNIYECECGRNSQGEFCGSCLPLYNQQPYRAGENCTECQCYGHAESCSYNETISDIGMSLNTNNEHVGGGMCTNCTQQTAGVNCESCIDYYYRPSDVRQNDSMPCVPCGCTLEGVVVSPTSGLFGDCVVNNDIILPPNHLNQMMQPGHCYCKEFVGGSKCDQCLPTYYNLTAENPQGCQECQCYLPGTINGSNICDKISGKCSCKDSVKGFLCDQCRDNFHTLTHANPEGCEPCNCNVGASYSQVCNKTTAQCDCKPTTYGLTCSSMLEGFYYPDIDSLSVEPELNSKFLNFNMSLGSFGQGFIYLNGSWFTEFVFPRSGHGNTIAGEYYIYMRYISTATVTTETSMAIQSQVLKSSMTHQVCTSSWCYSLLLEELLFATSGDVTFVSLSSNHIILLDSIVLVPHEFIDGTRGNITIGTPSNCDLVTRSAGQTLDMACEQYIYSVSLLYYEEGVPCGCDVTGSLFSNCSQRGGACACKPGVTGRTCDECSPGFYNFTSLGCQACNCAGVDQYCDAVTGVCSCSPTTQGFYCDECISNYWNWSPSGCQACGCNAVGSTNPQCDLITGECSCKVGVTTAKCESCLSNYYDLAANGCTPCTCNLVGSWSEICHNNTGQCDCKENVIGRDCSICSEDSYYFGADNSTGCLTCSCMGITDQCSSYREYIPPIQLELTSAVVTDLNSTIINEPVRRNSNSSVTVSSSKFYLRVDSPAEGRLLMYYSSVLEVTYRPSPILVSTVEVSVYLEGDDSRLISSPISIPQGALALLQFKIPLLETGWRNESGEVLSRERFLESLQLINFLYLPLNIGENTLTVLDLKMAPTTSSSLVEECLCGEAYDGLSCETCSNGYTRQALDTTSLGICVPCMCNNNTALCDAETGECIGCDRNTTGFFCELCLPGYYKDIVINKESCLQCPCYEYGTESTVCGYSNETLTCTFCKTGYIGDLCDQCDESYWYNGSHCVSCECNGNSFTCDYNTGECLDCGNNSTGSHCQFCTSGYYGDASSQNCTGCSCDEIGSLSPTCNHTTGQCTCADHVVGRTCGECEYEFWNFTSAGCTACECELDGSLSTQCSLTTGICECRENATGSKCELCALGSFGLPLHACQDCSCDEIGSVNHSLPCDLYYGDCDCLPGVTGRQCDHCDDMYYNFTSSGCTECGDCERRLGAVADSHLSLSQQHLNYSGHLEDAVNNHSLLINLTNQISTRVMTETESVFDIHKAVLMVLNDVNILGRSFVANRTLLEDNLSLYMNMSSDLMTSVQSFIEGILNTQKKSIELSTSVVELQDRVDLTLQQKREFEERIATDLELNQNYWQFQDDKLSDERAASNKLLSGMRDHINLVEQSTRHALLEGVTAHVLSVNTTSVYAVHSGLLSSVVSFEDDLEDLVMQCVNVTDLLNLTQLSYDYIEEAYQSVIKSLNQSDSALGRASQRYNDSTNDISRLEESALTLISTWREVDMNLLDVEAMLNNDTNTLPHLINAVEKYIHDAANSTSIIGNLSLEDVSVVSIYSMYRNASNYVDSLVEVADRLNHSLYEHQDTLSTERLDHINILYANNTDSLQRANQTVLAYTLWSIEKETDVVEMNKLTSNLSATAEAVQVEVNQSSITLSLLREDLVNNIQLTNQIEDSFDVITRYNGDALSEIVELSPVITSHVSLAELLQNTSETISESIAALYPQVDFVNRTITNVTDTMERISSLESANSRRIADLELQLVELEQKLARAKEWSRFVKQPFQIDTNTTLAYNFTATKDSVLEVSLEFSLSTHDPHTLWHIMSHASAYEMMLSFDDNALLLAVYEGDELTVLKSRSFICQSCWFRAAVSSYGQRLSLQVSDLTHDSLPVIDEEMGKNHYSSYGYLQLSIGSVMPGSYFNNSIFREACIQNVDVMGYSIGLPETNSKRSCCQAPQESIIRTSVMSLNGFGYANINRFLKLQSEFSLSVVLRTYSPDGIIISLLEADSSSQVELLMVRGRITLQSATQSLSNSASLNYYNYGDWVNLSCSIRNTTFVCDIQSGELFEQLTLELSDDLLVVSEVLLGTTMSANVNRFSGCLANLTINGYLTDIWEDVAEYKGLKPYCYEEVLSGLSLESYNSLSTLDPALITEDVYNIEVEFLSMSMSGSVMALSYDNVCLEIGLIQSYLAVIYSTSGTVQSFQSAESLVDYQLHTVSISLNTSSPKVELDGKSSAIFKTNMSTTGLCKQNSSWSLQLGDYKEKLLPIETGFVGGITRMTINEWTLPLLTTSIYSNSSMMALSGIPASPVIVIPPNLITSPPPPTAPPPTCSPPKAITYLANGKRFGDKPVSYATFSLSSVADKFDLSVAMTIQFRAVSSVGMLLYMADDDATPSQWMSVFLRDGYINFAVQTDSMQSTIIQSNYQYADGQWWTVTLLRFHNFMALVVNGKKDYANNGMVLSDASHMNVTTDLFVGGLTVKLQRSAPSMVISNSFHGCIDYVAFSSFHIQEKIVFNLTNPTTSRGTSSCYAEIDNGVYLSETSYIHLGSHVNVTVESSFEFGIRIRTIDRNYLIMSAVDSLCYMSLFVNETQVVIAVGHLFGGERLIIHPKAVSMSTNLCDSIGDHIKISLKHEILNITIAEDQYQYELKFEQLWRLTNADIFIGRVPEEINLPSHIPDVGIRGCTDSIELNEVKLEPESFITSFNTTVGCFN